MKTVKQMKYESQFIMVKCLKCNKEKLIHKHYYIKNKDKYRQFCSEMCKIYYDDPKQEHIMKHINTSNFHYLVGLIATDGHIGYPGCTPSTKSYYCNIKLNKEDNALLYEIQNIFGGSVNLEGKRTCSWRVSNKEFVEYLKNIGMTNVKTYNLNLDEYFSTLLYDYKISFLRGVIDGDGSISVQNRKSRKLPCNGLQCSSNICSASLSFITLIGEYFKNGILSERTKKQNKKATCSLYYYYINGPEIINAMNPIYSISAGSLVMKRKLILFNIIKHYYETKTLTYS